MRQTLKAGLSSAFLVISLWAGLVHVSEAALLATRFHSTLPEYLLGPIHPDGSTVRMKFGIFDAGWIIPIEPFLYEVTLNPGDTTSASVSSGVAFDQFVTMLTDGTSGHSEKGIWIEMNGNASGVTEYCYFFDTSADCLLNGPPTSAPDLSGCFFSIGQTSNDVRQQVTGLRTAFLGLLQSVGVA